MPSHTAGCGVPESGYNAHTEKKAICPGGKKKNIPCTSMTFLAHCIAFFCRGKQRHRLRFLNYYLNGLFGPVIHSVVPRTGCLDLLQILVAGEPSPACCDICTAGYGLLWSVMILCSFWCLQCILYIHHSLNRVIDYTKAIFSSNPASLDLPGILPQLSYLLL